MLEVDEASVCQEGDGDGDPQSELWSFEFCKNETDGVVDCEADGAKAREEQG